MKSGESVKLGADGESLQAEERLRWLPSLGYAPSMDSASLASCHMDLTCPQFKRRSKVTEKHISHHVLYYGATKLKPNVLEAAYN